MVKNYRYVFYTLKYFKKYWSKLLFIFLFSIIIILLSIIPIEITKRLIDIAIPAQDLNLVFKMIAVIFSVHLVLLILSYFQDLMLTKLSLDITKKIQVDFFAKLLNVPNKYYSGFKEGQLMERAIDDIQEVVDSTFDLILSPILAIMSAVITVIYMFSISSSLTILAIVFIPLFIIIILPVNRIVRKKYSAIKISYAGVYSIFQEKLLNIPNIIKRNKKKVEERKLSQKIKQFNDLQYDYEKFSTKLESVIAIVSDIVPYVIILYAVYEIIQGRFQVGTLLAFIMLTPRLFEPVQELASKELEFQTLEITAKRVFSILHDAKEVNEK